MKRTAIALVGMAFAGLALAQAEAPATVSNVQGLATVTSGNQLSNVTAGMALPEGGLLMVTQGATVTVKFASGCTATLVGGQSLTISNTSCEAFAKLPAPATGVLTATNAGYAAVGVLTAGVLYNQTRGRGQGAVVVLPPEPGPPTVILPPAANPTPPAPTPISPS